MTTKFVGTSFRIVTVIVCVSVWPLAVAVTSTTRVAVPFSKSGASANVKTPVVALIKKSTSLAPPVIE